MLIHQIMSQPAITCGIDDSLNRAAQLMWDHDFGIVPIVSADDRVVAVLTDRDICMAAYTQGKPLAELSVRIAMSKELHACHTQDTLEQAEQIMRDHQLRRLPVVDREGKAVGMLSLNDVACAMARHPHGYTSAHDGTSSTATALTLAAVSAHRIEEANFKLV